MRVDDKRIRRALIREAERRGALLAQAAGESQIAASHAEALAFTELAAKVWTVACDGERWAVEFIRDSIDGKPKETLHLNAEITRRAQELSDDELASIAAGRSARVADTADGPQVPASLHRVHNAELEARKDSPGDL